MFRVLVFALALMVPSVGFAHEGGHVSGLAYGFMHPIGGLDHVLAMIAVGVFAFVLGGRALWLVPLSFVSMMIVGFWLGAGAIGLPFVELGIALSSVVIGGLATLGRPMPLVLAAGLVGVFAVFHGHAHGAEMPVGEGGLLYALGFVGATALLHGAGLVTALGVARLVGRHGQGLARAAGAGFALGGVGVLAGWL